ncbi:MAG: dihydrolipoyl dehydrogenase [candidate division WS1 bacterium]|jgi:dihydrolipoamide dehydrogenase|nr:dihydrolipoyl dehydrogenase [candidate division WS1 bacterium]
MSAEVQKFDVVVIGSGPAGYVAALWAAERGARAALVEKKYLGGTCLNVGCIPSKALIHCVEMLDMARSGKRFGITFGEPQVDFDKVRGYKDRVVKQLVTGVEHLLNKREVAVFRGLGRLQGPGEVAVELEDGTVSLQADRILLCTGSEPVCLPMCSLDDPAIMTSDNAVNLPGPPKSLAIIGGGAIGLEFAYVYSGFGTQVTVVEMLPRLLPSEDPEASEVLARALVKRGVKIAVNSKVTEVADSDQGKRLVYECEGECTTIEAEMALLAVGRRASTAGLGLEEAGVALERGRVQVNERLQTSVPSIFAAGDCLRGIGLAHLASHEGLAAVDFALGREAHVNLDCVPSGIYTVPEVASVGLREHEAQERGLEITVGKFPFSALGKATVLNEREGFVKLIAEPGTGRMLGGTIVGPKATELIAEVALAVENQLSMEDIADTIHGHPTLNESVGEAALAGLGTPLHNLP